MSLWNLRNAKTEDLKPLYYEDYHKSDRMENDQIRKDDNPDHNSSLDPALEAIKCKWEKYVFSFMNMNVHLVSER